MAQPTIFIGYCHKDEAWKDRLLTQLRVLMLDGEFEVWEDRQMATGAAWQPEIKKAINRASLAILLISADFLASNFVRGEAVPGWLKQRNQAGLTIFPVILRPCPWQRVTWLAAQPVRPHAGKPLSAFSEYEIEETLTNLALEIERLLQTFTPPDLLPTPPEATPTPFALVESFPVDGQRITKSEIKKIYLKFNHPVDRESVVFIENYYVQENLYCQWTICGWIQFAEDYTKLIWHVDDKELMDDNLYGPLEIDYERIEIRVGRRSAGERVRDTSGHELPPTTIRIFIVAEEPVADEQLAPVNYNTATIRKLLTAAFSDEDLTALCFDHFRDVYHKFGRGLGHTEKVQLLLEYCEQNLAFETLLTLVEAENPTQYERFKSTLRRN